MSPDEDDETAPEASADYLDEVDAYVDALLTREEMKLRRNLIELLIEIRQYLDQR